MLAHVVRLRPCRLGIVGVTLSAMRREFRATSTPDLRRRHDRNIVGLTLARIERRLPIPVQWLDRWGSTLVLMMIGTRVWRALRRLGWGC
jgi:hypothetical protein